ncbi:hypothetical protein [Mesomycoplasma hyorhinis]|uniref:hypothetical protein n=1 Tax=Mesomycoplasma hyorhinis TaxID=2100 RepID=UPI001C05A476|nr:hypothetical protein [Mesomycoplasma hyorhinis]
MNIELWKNQANSINVFFEAAPIILIIFIVFSILLNIFYWWLAKSNKVIVLKNHKKLEFNKFKFKHYFISLSICISVLFIIIFVYFWIWYSHISNWWNWGKESGFISLNSKKITAFTKEFNTEENIKWLNSIKWWFNSWQNWKFS